MPGVPRGQRGGFHVGQLGVHVYSPPVVLLSTATAYFELGRPMCAQLLACPSVWTEPCCFSFCPNHDLVGLPGACMLQCLSSSASTPVGATLWARSSTPVVLHFLRKAQPHMCVQQHPTVSAVSPGKAALHANTTVLCYFLLSPCGGPAGTCSPVAVHNDTRIHVWVEKPRACSLTYSSSCWS